MTTREAEKIAAASAALSYVRPGEVLGVGSGTTVALFIEALARFPIRPSAAVATSRDTHSRLEDAGIPVVELSAAGEIRVYIDGADEIDAVGRLIKGAGGALTMEKIVASASHLFVCIADESKLVERLGDHAPVPVEVLPSAATRVGQQLEALGGAVALRAGSPTDAGNPILDVMGLDVSNPELLEAALEALPGVVGCGVFAARRADIGLIGLSDGTVRKVTFPGGV